MHSENELIKSIMMAGMTVFVNGRVGKDLNVG